MLGFVNVPRSRQIVPTSTEIPEGYGDLAKRLHLDAAVTHQSDREVFERWLASKGIRRYSLSAVNRYLNKQFGWNFFRCMSTRRASFLHGIPWGWRPLRERDQPHSGVWMDSDGDQRIGDDRGHAYWRAAENGYLLGKQNHIYQKPIPMPVLLRVEEINKQFPDARFYVSDEVRRLPIPKDPFLLVRYAGTDYVIERWDEPNFEG